MSSYRSDGGRIPRLRDMGPQARNVSSPMIAAQSKPSVSNAPLSARPQIPRLATPSTKTRRAASMSEAEESRPIIARSNIPSLHDIRFYAPPQAPPHPFPSRSPLSATTNEYASPVVQTPPLLQSSPNLDHRSPALDRPRNILRRKAPTIGQQTTGNKTQVESVRPSGLNVIIPTTPSPNPPQTILPHSSSQTQIASKIPSPMVSQERNINTPQEHQVYHGPKELASLRTTVNTQNLPPPTPLVPSASTPSTRYSGSPGVWSRTSTPASLSSCSPGIVQPVKVGSRLRLPSPSHTRLPVFSPQVQKSTSQGSRSTGRSPNLVQGSGSTTSLASDGPEGLAAKADFTRPPPPTSLLPRKTSVKPSLPRQTKTNMEVSPDSEQANTEGVVERNDTTSAASTVDIPAQAPRRPSRDGTDQLVLEPSPVVQTNISPRALKGHKRRGSGESVFAIASNRSATTSVDSLQSRASSRIHTRTPISPELSRKSPRTLIKEPKAPKTPNEEASPEKTRRFGLFSKKSKPELDARSMESRSIRKGPAAGTGHEGYGKYAHRGRRPSVSSNSDGRARSTSTTRSVPKSVSSKGSTKGRSDVELDDFLLERLEPVFINGGGMDGATLSRTQSEQSTSGLSTVSAPAPIQNSKIPLPSGYTFETPSTSKGKPVDSRELHRRGFSTPSAPVPSSAATRSKIPGASHSTTRARNDASSSTQSLPRTNTPGLSARHVELQPQPQVKKPSKKGLNLKWPFFQKYSAVPLPEASMPLAPQVPAGVARVGVHRPVAHYAMVDTDSDPLEDIIHKLQDSPPTEEDGEQPDIPVEIPPALNIRKPSQSILLPSPPKLNREFQGGRPSSPKVYFQREPTTVSPGTSMESERRSRLASVGRIPRVVSRRDRQHKPAFQSFSRPFSVVETPSLSAPVTDIPQEFSPLHRPVGSQPDGPRNNRFGFDLTTPFGDPSKGSILDFIAGPYSKTEFLAFSPRKDSMFSTSSGSESLAAITAVIPAPEAEMTEDEVWGEYDEFIDNVLSPETPNPPFFVDYEPGEKFEMATMASRALQLGLNGDTRSPEGQKHTEQPKVALIPASPRSSVTSVRLRRSKIAPALHASLSPTSQPSLGDMLARYHEDQMEEPVHNPEPSGTLTPVLEAEKQPSSLLSSPDLNVSPSFETCRHRNTILFDIAERDREGPTAQTNIRSGSLMTSRWLSFGRVLFSPAHNHLRNGEQEKILVVDGLGNDDWSFYCALTYPKAEVYCLNEGPTPTASKHPQAWQPPPNHHTIHHASLEDTVPFPKGFFTVTVLRFPAACSERAQDNIVSECKRVLRAGGYLEMSILDLDMVNMGIHTRKAVRKLKETMYLSDTNISLKPASDSIQKMLGLHGFDNLRRCMVRIPVAGMIVRTSASSSSTSSSNPSIMTTAVTSSTALSATSDLSTKLRSKPHEKSSSNDTVLSLGDLLSDPEPSPSNDESIRKIVARVGRWWYTRCYESPILPNGDVDLSIWNDRKVLRECQQRGTGFRLLIAHTQKPSEMRRTASV